MIELVKKSSGAVELDKHATQIITTAYVDEQIDKVEADITALNGKVVDNTMAIKEVEFELTGAFNNYGEYINNKIDAMSEEIANKFDEYDEEIMPAIAEVLENHETRVSEIENTLPTIGEKPWVKIKSITIKEPVNKLDFSIPANTYKEVFVRGKYKWVRKEGTSGTVYITIGSEDNSYSYSRIGNTGGTGSFYYYVVEGRVGADGYPLFTVYNSTSVYSGSSTATNLYPNNIEASEYLPPFSIYCSSDVQFAKDGTFEIWGR